MKIQLFDIKIETFIQSLQKPTTAKVLRTIDLLERFGNQFGMPHSKNVKKNIFELRVRGQQEVRIFYTFHQNTVVLLHGFIKKSQKTPQQELAVAQTKASTLDRV